MYIKCKKLHEHAVLPTYAHSQDAGMDLYAVEEVAVPAHERVLIPTGLAVAIPSGYVGLIWDKSGVSTKYGLKTLAGVIDAGYRGEIRIGIFNTSDTAYTFHAGDKVAQMLIQKIERPEIQEADVLEDSERGEDGFGSTGI